MYEILLNFLESTTGDIHQLCHDCHIFARSVKLALLQRWDELTLIWPTIGMLLVWVGLSYASVHRHNDYRERGAV